MEAQRLGAFDLGAGGLHDELELEAVHVTGASPEATIANLELDVAHLDAVDLAGARLRHLALRNCRVTGGNLANVAVHGGVAERCTFDQVRLTGLSWQEGVLRDVSFHGCRIDLASFAATQLERVRFESCSLAHSDLQDARIAATVFEDCDLREIDLSGARLAAAATFATTLGIEILREDEPGSCRTIRDARADG